MGQRGDEHSFQTITKILYDTNNAYHIAKTLKYYQYAQKVDHVFENNPYGWSKDEYYKEVNRRLGINTTNSETKIEIEVAKKRSFTKKFPVRA